MSAKKAKKLIAENVPKMSAFKWNPENSRAAILLAEGLTYEKVGKEIGKSTKTIQRWMADIEFSAEVDRLSVLTGIASKAERLRIAKRVIKQKIDTDFISTEKDLLDWLKFAQAETDGIKLNFAELFAAFDEDAAPVE
jgi:hypothetical protein